MNKDQIMGWTILLGSILVIITNFYLAFLSPWTTRASVWEMIFGEFTAPFVVVFRVDGEDFKEAWRLFPRFAERGLSFIDCTSVVLMRVRCVENMVSFDKDFDGIMPRIS